MGHISGVVVFMDDILVFGKTQSEHDIALERVRSTLRASGLTLNESKCHFNLSSVHFLGHVISANGIQPDPAKLSAIAELKAPTDLQSLHRTLGLFTYLSKFLQTWPQCCSSLLPASI